MEGGLLEDEVACLHVVPAKKKKKCILDMGKLRERRTCWQSGLCREDLGEPWNGSELPMLETAGRLQKGRDSSSAAEIRDSDFESLTGER